ncbi:TonB-dependent receptor domain-containing protein [Amphiplicatus metriothermophilus]|uniref:TonB-dependent Receptor Plug Domain n=1 Tax=Amphiplicatus metriothermophilus TaxID=1519374 RepID=A0A239PSP3_9PROT|nr:TonB-dependent receptor [Amphiplicatus metriothermophilus]MBB5519226.1 outer membrane receptor protein involved in Fe transport [Amphiplicatus metriothermophilus]SNT73295.1 TonB-dependent Receptor Plug Domain [Amphiplicatus metriothermophilus]
MRPSLTLIVCFAAVFGAAGAEDGEQDRQANAAEATARALPVEQILDDFARRFDVSFIFDSRLLSGLRMSPADASLPPEMALTESLRSANLSLHKVGAKTYAITAASAAPAPAAIPAANLFTTTPPDTIVVTAAASGIAASSGARHLYTLDRSYLELLNLSRPSEVIYDLPQSLASVTRANTALYGAAAGLELADLRGMGPQRTLVLVNGRRRAPVFGNASMFGVDLSSLAEPFLERIEIVGRSHGARLGPEAVAGALNFVTRKPVSGVEAGARYGLSQRGDAEELSLHALGGARFFDDAGELTLGLAYAREDGLVGADRAVTAQPYGFAIDGEMGFGDGAEFLPGFGGSAFTPEGRLAGAIAADGSFLPAVLAVGPLALTGDGGIEPFEGRLDQLFNWAAFQNTLLPNERLLGLIDIGYDLSANSRLFLEAHIGHARTDVQLAPAPTTAFQGVDPMLADGAPVDIAHPAVPDSVRNFAFDVFGPDIQGLVVERRYTELGPRRGDVKRRYNDIVFGLETAAGAEGTLRFFYRYGRTSGRASDQNRIDRDRLLTALDPAACAAARGCVPVDLFTLGGLSPEAADFIRAPVLRRQVFLQEHEIAAKYDGPEIDLFGFPLDLDGGVGWRRSKIGERDLAPKGVTAMAAFINNEYEGAVDIGEAYATLFAPILPDASALGSVDLNLAWRVAGSSTFGVAQNFESALDWRPAPGLALFAEHHIGERPPSVVEQFVNGQRTHEFFLDPCASAEPSQAAAENCAAGASLSAPTDFRQTDFLAERMTLGSPDLDPERTRTLSAGVDYRGADVLGLPGRIGLRAVWLDYRIENRIAAPTYPLEECFESPGFSAPSCGTSALTGEPLIRRDSATGQIDFIATELRNEGSFSWRGFDFEARYAYEPRGLGPVDRLWVSGLHTYTEKVVSRNPGAPEDDLTGSLRYPRHRSLIAAGVAVSRVNLMLLANRRGRVRTLEADHPAAFIPAITTIDLAAEAAIGAAVLGFSVHNMTDRAPPVAALEEGGGAISEYYDPVGRRFALRVRAAF